MSPDIWERDDGLIAIDFHPPHGPYVTLRRDQWLALVARVQTLVKTGLRS